MSQKRDIQIAIFLLVVLSEDSVQKFKNQKLVIKVK